MGKARKSENSPKSMTTSNSSPSASEDAQDQNSHRTPNKNSSTALNSNTSSSPEMSKREHMMRLAFTRAMESIPSSALSEAVFEESFPESYTANKKFFDQIAEKFGSTWLASVTAEFDAILEERKMPEKLRLLQQLDQEGVARANQEEEEDDTEEEPAIFDKVEVQKKQRDYLLEHLRKLEQEKQDMLEKQNAAVERRKGAQEKLAAILPEFQKLQEPLREWNELKELIGDLQREPADLNL
eukprot:TRINITY_DN8390_c0_g1_i1.p1 TRINITY_DN8390_c0_g1~~TRINITY_DN8390_c0_g1_i1.p1  ORF type:complete len:241 (+),score=60.26 TRINITY_DN8390_c0_g1_i1:126-848(+)